MSRTVQHRRGTTADHESFVGAEGEVTVDIDKMTAVVHDGVTPGGHPLAKADDVGEEKVSSSDIDQIVRIFQEDYDALSPPDQRTLYVIVPKRLVGEPLYMLLIGNDIAFSQ